MSNSTPQPAGPPPTRNGNSLLIGVLVGVVVVALIAAGIGIYAGKHHNGGVLSYFPKKSPPVNPFRHGASIPLPFLYFGFW